MSDMDAVRCTAKRGPHRCVLLPEHKGDHLMLAWVTKLERDSADAIVHDGDTLREGDDGADYPYDPVNNPDGYR